VPAFRPRLVATTMFLSVVLCWPVVLTSSCGLWSSAGLDSYLSTPCWACHHSARSSTDFNYPRHLPLPRGHALPFERLVVPAGFVCFVFFFCFGSVVFLCVFFLCFFFFFGFFVFCFFCFVFYIFRFFFFCLFVGVLFVFVFLLGLLFFLCFFFFLFFFCGCFFFWFLFVFVFFGFWCFMFVFFFYFFFFVFFGFALVSEFGRWPSVLLPRIVTWLAFNNKNSTIHAAYHDRVLSSSASYVCPSRTRRSPGPTFHDLLN